MIYVYVFFQNLNIGICTEAVRLIRYSKKKTLRAREIKTSVRLFFYYLK